MKKNTLIIGLVLLFFNSMSAQFTVKKIDGTPFVNNEIIEFTTYGNSSAELKFSVYNQGTENLDFRIRCMNLINATGSNFQLCWGLECISDVNVNGIYPDYQNIINAGQNTVALNDSFKNFNAGDGTNYPMDYSFRFLSRDLNGNAVGSTFNITYRYQGPLSLEQKDKLNSMGVKVLNTKAQNYVGLEIQKNVNFAIYTIQGQQIQSGTLENNTNLDVSTLHTGLYFLNFSNETGLADTVKIYKQ